MTLHEALRVCAGGSEKFHWEPKPVAHSGWKGAWIIFREGKLFLQGEGGELVPYAFTAQDVMAEWVVIL
jgi:hypothetical protein